MKLLKILFILIVVLVVASGAGYLYFESYYDNTINDKSGTKEVVAVTIPAGASREQIANTLKEKGLIDNTFIFNLYVRRSGKGPQLKAGSYEFFNNQSMVEIVDELAKGAQVKGVKVLLPEGLRYDEVVKIIDTTYEDAGITNVDPLKLTVIIEKPDNYTFTPEIKTFLTENKPAGKSLEGFLFPDTYELSKTATEEQIIIKLLTNFMSKSKTLPAAEDYTFYEYLTIASIVEREALGDKEDEEIAGIFVRRINAGDKIGADATVLYPYKRWKPEPTAKELATDTPYNTRLKVGLPPTPIANPGLKAMQGTWNVEESKYYFFLHTPSGETYFSKTLEEHNANINKYLR